MSEQLEGAYRITLTNGATVHATWRCDQHAEVELIRGVGMLLAEADGAGVIRAIDEFGDLIYIPTRNIVTLSIGHPHAVDNPIPSLEDLQARLDAMKAA